MLEQRRFVTRRDFLKLGGAGLALSAGLPLVAACGEGSGQGSGRQGSPGITATYMKSGTYDVAAEEFASGFEQDNGTSVDIEAFPYAALRQNNTNAVISGGCDYDVVSGSYYLANIYDSFRPLDDLANRDGFAGALAPGLWEQSEFNGGKHIGVPYGPDAYGLMYRTDLWEQAGLSLPRTWDDFTAAMEKLQTDYAGQGISPLVFYGGAPEQLPALFFATYDGFFVNGGGKYQLDEAKAVDAISYGERMLGFMPDNATALSIDEANTLFTDGKAATLYGWPSFVLAAADDPESSQIVGKYEVGGIPEPENDKALFTKYGINPVLESTYADKGLLDRYAHYLPGEQANLARAMNPPLSGEAQDFLASTLGEVFTGNTTAEEAVGAVNEEWAGLEVPSPLAQAAERNGLVG